jgi:Domain of unknown function (DUF4342)
MTQTDPNANIEQRTGYGVEELQVMGEQLLTRVREVIHEGNVRRIIIKQDDRTLLEIPLTVGVAGVVLAPVWAAIGVLGALIAQCSIEVVRSDSPSEVAKDAVEDVADTVTPPENPTTF